MPSLGDEYYDVRVEYDIIDEDESVGLEISFEFDVFFVNDKGEEINLFDSLTPAEFDEVIEAIKEDIKRDDYYY
jgi:hypothetical protein